MTDETPRNLDSMPTMPPRETPRAERPRIDEAETMQPRAEPRAAARDLDSVPTMAPQWRVAGKRWQAGEAILGRYVVEGELGRGGMGVVYGCLDKVGGVRVAVKALPPEVAHDRVEMEDVRENFRLVSGLRHPNIAGVRTLEQNADGECFLVMDVAEGTSLREWMKAKWRTGAVSVEEAVPILRQVAAALDYAHGERVVHRDVKPGNVMVDAQGRARVLDFGLASQIQSSLSRVSRDLGDTSGTRPYMAPEQWEGRKQDAKTDQYALAVMAYEMLAGSLPFDGNDPTVLREAVLHADIEDIPGAGTAAMAALRRGMAKTRAERFETCGEFVDALAGIARDKPAARRNERSAAASGGTPVDGDVFLLKVRVAKEVKEAKADEEEATPEERQELDAIRDRFAAGYEALRVGNVAAGERWFSETEDALDAWRKRVAARKERERKEAEERRERERLEQEKREALARAEAEERRERERLEREKREALVRAEAEERRERERLKREQRKALARAEEEKRRQEAEKEAARLAAERSAKRKKAAKVAGIAALVLLVCACVWNGVQKIADSRRAAKVQRMLGTGQQAGETRTITLPGGAAMEMVWCPAGEFTMGSPADEGGRDNDETQHRVTLTKGFWMAKTEVTQAQWKSVMGNNPSEFKGDDLAVECVSWDDCREFCRKTGLQLPTEAQWEYACRAGSEGPYAGTGRLEDMGWFDDNSENQMHPVGQKRPNAWGLLDMHGNMWEWCRDWYGPYGGGAVTDPKGPGSGSDRVGRGGSWVSYARECRSANRGCNSPDCRGIILGFRPSMDSIP